MDIKHAARTFIGTRSENQDTFLEMPEIGVFGIFDGMGGHHDGAKAAHLAAETIHKTYTARADTPPELAIAAANEAVLDAGGPDARHPHAYRGMGTTAVVLHLPSKTVAWCGDSRLYKASPHHAATGQAQHLTIDHSAPGALLRAEAWTWEEYKTTNTSSLQQHVGMVGAVPEVESILVEAGDRFLILTDGLLCVPEDVIAQALSLRDIERCADALLDASKTHDATDNVTFVVVDVEAL